MLNCKEITELASRRFDSQISWYSKIELSVHFLICRNCRRYAKQLAFLQQAFIKAETQTKKVVLSDAARQRIKKKLEENQA